MVITLSGDNGFLIRSELNKLVSEYLKDGSDLGIEKIDSLDISFEDLSQSLSSYSLLSPSRLVILNQPSKINQFTDNIGQLVDSLPPSTNLVIVEPSLDKRLSYYKLLTSSTDFRMLSKLDGQKLIDWIISYTKDRGGEVNYSTAQHLVEWVGDNQILIASEIEKLTLYNPNISNETIDLLSEQSADSTIFQLLDAAFSAKTKIALDIYDDQRSQRVEPELILSMISWQVQVLALCVTSKNLSFDRVVSMTKMSPYALQKAKQIASKLSFSRLKTMVSELSQMDVRSKTISFDLDEGLKNFIVGLSY